MRTGKIYKVTNKINGKCYIGQTVKAVEKRYKRHIVDSKKDNYCFHRALRKYGIENFEIEIIEDNIPLLNLDEREIYWISYFDSYYMNNGYNMTYGGDSLTETIRKLSDKDVDEIKSLLKNTDLSETDISKLYKVSIYAISDINNGKSWWTDTCE